MDLLLDDITYKYLCYVDYVDLHNFCNTNKRYNSMYNESMLRNRLYEKIQVIFPIDLTITTIMENINKQIINIIYNHYSPLPKWVNEEVFMNEFKKKIYHHISNNMAILYIRYGIEESITLSTNVTGVFLVSNKLPISDRYEMFEIDHDHIILSEEAKTYFKHGIKNAIVDNKKIYDYIIDRQIVNHVICNLLFMVH